MLKKELIRRICSLSLKYGHLAEEGRRRSEQTSSSIFFFPSLAGRVLLVTSQTAASTLKYINMASSYKAEPSTLSSLRSSSSRRGLFHGKTHLTTNPSAHLRAFSFEEKKFGLWHRAPFVSQNHKKNCEKLIC